MGSIVKHCQKNLDVCPKIDLGVQNVFLVGLQFKQTIQSLVSKSILYFKNQVNHPYIDFLLIIQVILSQKLATSAEHFVYQNCSECQNKTETSIFFKPHVLQVF